MSTCPGCTGDPVEHPSDAMTVTFDSAVAERMAAYNEGRWCGECFYGVVMDPPCCTQPTAGVTR